MYRQARPVLVSKSVAVIYLSSIVDREGHRHGERRRSPEARTKRSIFSSVTILLYLTAVKLKEEFSIHLILAYREQIVNKEATFEELASKYSDCSSASKGGDLGYFSAGQMQKAFEQASFALNVGELSEPVFTDSGVHIILRTG